ncbi:carbohydrate binding protein [Rhizobium azibense]|nr:carbohydrate binding protein [Rhizobium azibense]
MPAAYTYTAGQVTLTNGSTAVVGVGTAWKIAGIPGGIIFAEGVSLPLASVTDDTHAVAAIEWAGATGTYDYALVLTVYSQENMQNSTILTRLLAELDAGTIWKYDVAGTMADRAIYNERPAGFSYLVTDTVPAQLYVKGSATSGDWDGPFAYGTGPQGIQGIQGPIGPRGVNPRGTYSGATAYVVGDGVLYNGSTFVCVANTTGNAPPTLPTTSNTWWQLVAQKGTDGTGTGDVVGPAGAVDGALVAFDGVTGKLIKAASIATATMLGRTTAGVGAPEALTPAQARGVIGADFLSGHRNKIINGDFDIWQRGTNFTAVGYTADRWRLIPGTGATCAILRQALTLAQGELVGGAQYALQWNRSVAGSAASAIEQRIESVRTFSGKKVTVTFWAFASAATELIAVCDQNFGTGGSPSAALSAPDVTFNLGTSLQKFTATIDVPSISGKTLGTDGNDYLGLRFRRLQAATNPTATVYITHVSLVEGDATQELDPFSPRHIQLELTMCHRYFERQACQTASTYAIGCVRSASTGRCVCAYDTKRAEPTITAINPTLFSIFTSTAFAVTAVTVGNISKEKGLTSVNSSGLTPQQGIQIDWGVGAAFEIDAEL